MTHLWNETGKIMAHDGSLLVWLALREAGLSDATKQTVLRSWRTLMPLVTLDPNFDHEGRNLLAQATWSGARRSVRTPDVLTLADDDFYQVRPEDGWAQALLDRGAHPWLPTTSACTRHSVPLIEVAGPSGLGPMLAAEEQEAWHLLRQYVQHPTRPSWDTLLQHAWFTDRLGRSPGLLRTCVEAGLDPNARLPNGTPLAFLVIDVQVAQWLKAQGADLTRPDARGVNLVQHRDQRTNRLSGSERKAWMELMGWAPVNDQHVVTTALKGKVGAVRALFPSQDAMLGWRMPSATLGRDLNLLDLASVASAAGLVQHLVKFKAGTFPTASVDLATLWSDGGHTYLAEKSGDQLRQDTSIQRLKRPTDLGAAMEAWLAVSQEPLVAAEMEARSRQKECFCAWLLLATSEAQRKQVLERWLTWLQADATHWAARPNDFHFLIHPRAGSHTGLSALPAWVAELPPRLQIPFEAMQAVHAPNDPKFWPEAHTRLTRLCGLLDREQVSWQDPLWTGLRQALVTSKQGPAYEVALRAWEGQRCTPDDPPRRRRLRA
jgi:hypothetical protein